MALAPARAPLETGEAPSLALEAPPRPLPAPMALTGSTEPQSNQDALTSLHTDTGQTVTKNAAPPEWDLTSSIRKRR